MNKQNMESIKGQVSYWRERLDWYVNESADKNCSEEEIQAIRDLLKILEQIEKDGNYYNAEKSLKRFWETADIRVEIKEEMRRLLPADTRLAEYLDRYAKAGVRSGKKRVVFQSRGIQKVAVAASMVVMLIVGGTVGAVAQREGVFNKIVDDGEKLQIIVNSQGDFLEDWSILKSIDDLPIKYLRYAWTPTDIPHSISLETVELLDNNLSVSIVCRYSNHDTKQFVDATKRTFKNKLAITNQIHDGFDSYRKEKYESVEVSYLIKENEDYMEYIAVFVYGNSLFTVNSNCDFEIIENIVKENILSNNL